MKIDLEKLCTDILEEKRKKRKKTKKRTSKKYGWGYFGYGYPGVYDSIAAAGSEGGAGGE